MVWLRVEHGAGRDFSEGSFQVRAKDLSELLAVARPPQQRLCENPWASPQLTSEPGEAAGPSAGTPLWISTFVNLDSQRKLSTFSFLGSPDISLQSVSSPSWGTPGLTKLSNSDVDLAQFFLPLPDLCTPPASLSGDILFVL